MKPIFGAHAQYTWKPENKAETPLSKAFNDLVTSRLFEKANTRYTVAALDSLDTHHLLNGPEADMFMAITYAQDVLGTALKKEGTKPGSTQIRDITHITQQAYAGLLNLSDTAYIINADSKAVDTTQPPARSKWRPFTLGRNT